MHEIIKNAQNRMDKSVDFLKNEYASIRAGRANPSILNKIKVDYYETPTPINQLAAISVVESRILSINPYDSTSLDAIRRAILMSDIGINPVDDGKTIRIVFPRLTEQRRQEIAKDIKKMLESSKVSVRNIRRDAMEEIRTLKKDNLSGLSTDEISNLETEVSDLTKKYIDLLEGVAEDKINEVMEI